MMKSLTFQDTSLRVWTGSIAVLTNCSFYFSFHQLCDAFTQDCSGDIDRPLAMPPRQPTDLPSPSPQETSKGRPILVKIPTCPPSPFTNGGDHTTSIPNSSTFLRRRCWTIAAVVSGQWPRRRAQMPMFLHVSPMLCNFFQHPLLGCQ